jgi:hypothetical protein
MYRCVTQVTIQQNSSADWPNRNLQLNLNFVHSFECSDNWRDLTNKGKLIIPKNLYFTDANGVSRPLNGTNVNIGGFSSNPPLLLRGDAITIVAGYKYFIPAGRPITAASQEITQTSTMFTGYITKVHSKIPIEIEMEDNMWLVKLTPMDLVTFSATDTLEYVLQVMINKVNSVWGTQLTVNNTTMTTVGTAFSIGNEQGAQVLLKLRKLYGFESYFRGNELRSGVLVYLPADTLNANGTPKTPNIFAFQQNIISDELEYVRKDDINLSAVAHNTITEETGVLSKDGSAKTKKKRLEVLVTIKNNPLPGDTPYTTTIITPQNPVAENIEGERHEFYFRGAMSYADLANMAYLRLKLFYYTGLRGKFTTFGIPFVQQGDNIQIQDPILPERNGVFRVKEVDYSGGVEGLRQNIHLDFKINQ